MLKKLLITTFILPLAITWVHAQKVLSSKAVLRDSVVVAVHPAYNKVGSVHRWFFGTNYRKEWATPVNLPVIRISEIFGGLTPEKEGGGMQSKSLRLKDKTGKEWVLRSVEKTPDKLLPPALRETFAVDWLDDALSGQHPFSALVVPPLAAAARVPYANPIIGVVAADKALGEYSKIFANLVCLLEEREPIGESDNTIKMMANLIKDNDNTFDGEGFLRARMLDLMIGDWDRHEDQWRWAETKKDKGKAYIGVPRDRDQVFHLEEGLFPDIAAQPYISPLLGDFTYKPNYKYGPYKTRFLNPYPNAQMTHKQWMRVVDDFVAAETDDVLEAALRRLPGDTYKMGHDVLLVKLKARRAAMPATMDKYYRLIYRIADIRLSNKNEKVTITGLPDSSLQIMVNKINKEGKVKDTIMNVAYSPDITKEIRLYVSEGDDNIVINNTTSPISLRLIGGKAGNKVYNMVQSTANVRVYDTQNATFEGFTNKVSKHLSTDTLNTLFVQTNPYNVWMPLATGAINADDGLLIGAGFKYTKNDGFRKLPYTSSQQFTLTHAFATDAFRIKYVGEWMQAIGKADLVVQSAIQAPDNTVNFFGLGNGTVLNKQIPNYRRYYRTRFDTYEVDAALRWHISKSSTISAGPSFQFYHLDKGDNAGRFINNAPLIGSYDSLIVDRDKAHLGLSVNFNSNKRKGGILVTGGYFINVNIQGYTGLNSYSENFLQIRPEFTFYQKLTANGSVVLSDRVGGGVSFGKPAFYQSMFLGGQGNLLGYLQYRFAGRHMVFNNLQGRVKLFNIASYIIPGQLGLTGFYDTGRVWADEEKSDKWHHGVGGGLYFSPASLTVLQILAGHSEEGWYPYVSLNFRL